ncbi:DNA-formamidopyrimidine glycosylase [Candidatus Falkowbacteria bacterium HGW-Falkowbacteria-1]|jgi:formamidopyrimidine-DNA glycosylase|uniref:DNA-formamidopyrimidine glycosylase n=1 Tax=Candidatus Falkowbacteria bacterium HGW-Falkowbacteria-1 TaxID=2013768 RepID=A0A2N2EAM0_9BACT|nr:MAG: DNA-formamidopyrimidine glycosylase [Candidatus Falkowbacteria bacterium HGW-Falkowbacteria-1]
MPELPEVETIRNGLSRFVLFKEIKKLVLLDTNLFKGAENDLLKLRKDEFSQIDRLGKALVFSFKKSEKKMIIHLKMTGQLVYFSGKNLKEQAMLAGGHSEKGQNNLDISKFKHLRLRIEFFDNSFLILNDTRRFAYLKLLNIKEFEEVSGKLGVEPLSKGFSLSYFLKILEKRKKNIKAFLLDQSFVVGMGNIYADEILFASKLSPFRSVDSLDLKQKKVLYNNIKKILKLAIKKRGTTFSDYVDADGKSGNFSSVLKVYGRKGQKCRSCNGLVGKTKLVGRGTHYCPKCQN